LAEWLYEAGIGEARAALVIDGVIVEALVEPDDAGLRVGTVATARLVDSAAPRAGGVVRLDSGDEALLQRVPAGLSIGGTLTVLIVRSAIPEPGRNKLAVAVAAPPDAVPGEGPDLLARIGAGTVPVRRLLPHQPDALEAAGWSEMLDAAATGEIPFAGGVLRLSLNPAMTLFDVDGTLPPDALAIAGAGAAAAAIRRLDIGGSIGIDLPGMSNRAARLACADAIDAALPQPFERTAVNGFGFLQIVRRRQRPSLPELLAADPVGAATRAMLRRLEREPPPAPAKCPLPARIVDRLATRADWTMELARRTGVDRVFTAAGNQERRA
jgi:ribonuclease G